MWCAPAASSVDYCIRKSLHDDCFKPVSQRTETLSLRLMLGDCELSRGREANSRGNVLGARSAAAILGSAVHQRLNLRSTANEQCPDSFWRSNLVARNG